MNFNQLISEAQHCQLCPRLAHRTKVLSYGNGNPTARLMFIAEAPGRLGAEKTGIPLSGDSAGKNFDRLLESAKIIRDNIFITNAVICNPLTLDGNNDKPTVSEIENCSSILKKTIRCVRPRIIVTLGRVALESLKLIEYHELVLRINVGKIYKWYGCKLIPLYHPSMRVLVHRSFNQQVMDYKKVTKYLKSLNF